VEVKKLVDRPCKGIKSDHNIDRLKIRAEGKNENWRKKVNIKEDSIYARRLKRKKEEGGEGERIRFE